MEDCTEHVVKLQASAQNMHVYLRFSVYALIHERGIEMDGGFSCVLDKGHPMVVPTETNIKLFIEAMVKDVQDSVNAKQACDLSVHIYEKGSFKMKEHWLFNIVPLYKEPKRPLWKLRVELAALKQKIASLAPLEKPSYFLIALKKPVIKKEPADCDISNEQ